MFCIIHQGWNQINATLHDLYYDLSVGEPPFDRNGPARSD